MTDPIARNLISRLADELDHYRQLLTDSRHESHALATEARAFLAAEPQGEVAESELFGLMHRAAALLQQRHPQPVPVSERLPGAGDCDADGRLWVHQPHEACPESPAWELMLAKYASENYGAVCWLPAHALPLPISGEVEE